MWSDGDGDRYRFCSLQFEMAYAAGSIYLFGSTAYYIFYRLVMADCLVGPFLLSKAWFPLHDKCHDHDTKTKRL